MDLYIKNFHPGGTHDLFYTDPTIIKAFKDYLAHVVPRYANNPAVLGWELGNDLRCSSTLPASNSCNTNTITKWVAEICEPLTQTTLLSNSNPHCSKIHQEPRFPSPYNCWVYFQFTIPIMSD